jgi:radical SAM superfamily enzyme YgiQ (UPF0313 family)
MKITLIEPRLSNLVEGVSYQLQPLTLATLAGLTPADIEIKLIDDRFEEIDFEEVTDLVGITVTTHTAKRAYEIADEFRRRGVRVVLGGHHPTLLPDEAKAHADSLALGEVEGVWAQLLEDLKQKKLKPFYEGEERPNLKQMIRPRRDIFYGKPYLPVEQVETSRGCPFKCRFCSVTRFFGATFRHRPPEDVVAEIETLKCKTVFLVDDNIVANRAHAKELFKALIPLNIRWFSQASITMVLDEELLRLMHKSGCIGVLVGVESVNQESLNQINKRWNNVASYAENFKKIHDHGISIYASFVLGLDHDDPTTIFDQTLEFALAQKFLIAVFNPLTPYPGTPLYDDLAEQGRLLLDRWWLHQEQIGKAVFKPKLMSPEELEEGAREIKRKFYAYNSILKRSLNFRANLKSALDVYVYFAMNLKLRQEAMGTHARRYLTRVTKTVSDN